MRLYLEFQDENEIPFHFRCCLCYKVPIKFFIDIETPQIYCFKCTKSIEFEKNLFKGTEYEESIINNITVKCTKCLQFIFANQIHKHQRLCLNQINSIDKLNNEELTFCKYCFKQFNCNLKKCHFSQHKIPEQLIVEKQIEFYHCQFCYQAINFFEVKFHLATCQFKEIKCDVCSEIFVGNKFRDHYYLCVYQKIKQVNNQKDIFQHNIDILCQQRYLYFSEDLKYDQFQFGEVLYHDSSWTHQE